MFAFKSMFGFTREPTEMITTEPVVSADGAVIVRDSKNAIVTPTGEWQFVTLADAANGRREIVCLITPRDAAGKFVAGASRVQLVCRAAELLLWIPPCLWLRDTTGGWRRAVDYGKADRLRSLWARYGHVDDDAVADWISDFEPCDQDPRTPPKVPGSSPDGASATFGCRLMINSVVWSVGARSGDGMGEVVRGGVPIGRAARLLLKDGVVFAADHDGGWRRWNGGHFVHVPNIGPHQVPSAKAEPAPPAPVCAICSAPATRVMSGRDFCFDHSHYSEPAPPVTAIEQAMLTAAADAAA